MRSDQRVPLDVEGLLHDDPLHDLVAGRGRQGARVVVESTQVTETESLRQQLDIYKWFKAEISVNDSYIWIQALVSSSSSNKVRSKNYISYFSHKLMCMFVTSFSPD